MFWRREQRFRGALFDDFAEAHDDDAVAVLRDHGKVVADHEHRGSILAGEPNQELEDVALHDRVERRRRLVGDEQRGL